MAKTHERAFALIIAVLFLITSIGTGAAVIWQIRQDNNGQQAQTQDQENDPLAALQKCNIQEPVAAPKEPVPEVFKPEGDVTELETKDLDVGDGKEAKAGDCLVVKYHGTLAKDGTKFDGNFDTDAGLQFPVAVGAVIPGWDEGMVGVKEGGVRRLVIPSDLGYGETGSGAIPANADLVFVVKLVKVKD